MCLPYIIKADRSIRDGKKFFQHITLRLIYFRFLTFILFIILLNRKEKNASKAKEKADKLSTNGEELFFIVLVTWLIYLWLVSLTFIPFWIGEWKRWTNWSSNYSIFIIWFFFLRNPQRKLWENQNQNLFLYFSWFRLRSWHQNNGWELRIKNIAKTWLTVATSQRHW